MKSIVVELSLHFLMCLKVNNIKMTKPQQYAAFLDRLSETLESNTQRHGVLLAAQTLLDLSEEVEYLRHYGNKTCTAMADDALEELRKERVKV